MTPSPATRRASRFLPALVVCLATPASSAAQGPSPGELEGLLPSLAGAARGAALARLVDASKADAAEKAVRYGQEALELFARSPDPVNETVVLTEMGWAYMVLGKRELAEQHAERGRALAARTADVKGEARALSNLGTIARQWGDYARAIALFEDSLARYRGLGLKSETASSLNNLGVVYGFDLSDYEHALEYHFQALAVREEVGDKPGIALSLNNLGVIYGRLRQPDRALEHYARALEMRRALGLQGRVAATLHNIGDALGGLGRLDEALERHAEALRIREQIGEKAGVVASLLAIAQVETDLGRLHSAQRNLARADELAQQTASKREIALAKLGLAKVRRRQGQPAAAERLAREGLALADELGAPEPQRLILGELSEIQEQGGRPGAALASFRRLKAVEDRVLGEEKARRAQLLESRYQAERKERQIAVLREDQTRQELALQRRELQRNTIAGIAGVLVIAGFALYKRQKDLARINRQLEELSLTDSLTGLHNRRFLQSLVEGEVANSLRRHRDSLEHGVPAAGADLVFMIVDLDEFKSVNERFGHLTGDAVLAELSRVLEKACRDSDILVRWGGEEFLILCRFFERSEAGTVAERVRRAVECHPFAVGLDAPLHKTCSIGFAAFPFLPIAPQAVSWERVLAMADEALALAKRSGRNAWVGLSVGKAYGAEGLSTISHQIVAERVADGRLRIETSAPGPELRWGA
jgi:diguanylate cyclase (GGDEF)-like protein